SPSAPDERQIDEFAVADDPIDAPTIVGKIELARLILAERGDRKRGGKRGACRPTAVDVPGAPDLAAAIVGVEVDAEEIYIPAPVAIAADARTVVGWMCVFQDRQDERAGLAVGRWVEALGTLHPPPAIVAPCGASGLEVDLLQRTLPHIADE